MKAEGIVKQNSCIMDIGSGIGTSSTNNIGPVPSSCTASLTHPLCSCQYFSFWWSILLFQSHRTECRTNLAVIGPIQTFGGMGECWPICISLMMHTAVIMYSFFDPPTLQLSILLLWWSILSFQSHRTECQTNVVVIGPI